MQPAGPLQASEDTAVSAGRDGSLTGSAPTRAADAGEAAGRLRAWWRGLKLAQQFALMGSLVLVPAMGTIGQWVAEEIEVGVTQNSGASAALYMDKFLAPLVQDLGTSDKLTPETIQRLDGLMQRAAIGQRIVSIKVWRLDGVIVYSNYKPNIGKKYTATPKFTIAAQGSVAAEFEGHYHEQDAHERSIEGPLLEIYAPVRDLASERVIAVAEFYERADQFKADLASAHRKSWLVVALVTLLMMATLSGIVRRGSRTIEDQRTRLEDQVGELRQLLARNEALQGALAKAYKQSATINERFQRRIGSDLHDGPAQLLSYAILKLDGLAGMVNAVAPGNADARKDLTGLRAALGDAMKEIRNISAGLALPELSTLTLDEVVHKACRAHGERTGSWVKCEVGPLSDKVPNELKICAYRFVQEALNNAWRHAEAKSALVRVAQTESELEIEVADDGKGILDTGSSKPQGGGLGLPGLRDRIETLGGSLHIDTTPEKGTRLVARFSTEDIRRMGMLDA